MSNHSPDRVLKDLHARLMLMHIYPEELQPYKMDPHGSLTSCTFIITGHALDSIMQDAERYRKIKAALKG